VNQGEGDVVEDTQDILQALRRLAMPVGIVGAASGSERSCATGTLSYVSLRPPMIATSLALSSRTYELAHEAGFFSVSLLRDEQTGLAVAAAERATTKDKFGEFNLDSQQWHDVPALADCGAVLWCSLEQQHPVGNYMLCVGRIVKATLGTNRADSLIRFGGRYHAMGDPLDNAGESPYPL
jgi:flavin reductase (DIM6/NTAB) family NADH-FMN oxidoreductase RutF